MINHFDDFDDIPSGVYTPAEDSFLLLKNIKLNKGEKVLDIGCGSGIISLNIAFEKYDVTSVDINPAAVEYTSKMALRSGLKIKCHVSNLFDQIDEKYDVIIFNPPYLPTSDDEKIPGMENYAYDGGKDGTGTLFEFISHLNEYLKSGGRAYTVISSLSPMDKIYRKSLEYRLALKIIDSAKFDFETIHVCDLRPL